jgi:hypothetical protein
MSTPTIAPIETAWELEAIFANTECAAALVRDASERVLDVATELLLRHVAEMLDAEVKHLGALADRLGALPARRSSPASGARLPRPRGCMTRGAATTPARTMLRLVPRDEHGPRDTAGA